MLSRRGQCCSCSASFFAPTVFIGGAVGFLVGGGLYLANVRTDLASLAWAVGSGLFLLGSVSFVPSTCCSWAGRRRPRASDDDLTRRLPPRPAASFAEQPPSAKSRARQPTRIMEQHGAY